MQTRVISLLTIITLSLILSGCIWNTPATKMPPIVDNRTLAILNDEWIRPNNVSIIDSSAIVTYLYVNQDTNVTDETIQFNATDRKTHTSNLTIGAKDEICVLDVDSGNVTRF